MVSRGTAKETRRHAGAGRALRRTAEQRRSKSRRRSNQQTRQDRTDQPGSTAVSLEPGGAEKTKVVFLPTRTWISREKTESISSDSSGRADRRRAGYYLCLRF